MSDLCDSWARTQSGFRFVPVLSEPKAEDAWNGRVGFVHRAVMDDIADLSPYQVYASGAPAMVDAARADFCGQRHLPESEFFADSFLTAADTGS
ncbi:MAG: hypothetical protein WDN03_08380 [Rhizomicrobium sp.]